MNYVAGLLIGAGAGGIADRLMRAKDGVLSLNMLLGIAGAIVGINVAEILEVSALGDYRDEAAAGLGAIFILTGWRQLRA